MEIPASPMSTTLPLARRLRRAVLIALLLGLWAPFKIAWEQQINHEQDFLRYKGVSLSRKLSDQLGQGATIGVLGGMRNIVADFLWLNVTNAWMNREWFPLQSYVNICTTLQPRAPIFWDMGGWHLAWNASIDAAGTSSSPDLRHLKASKFWIDRGLDVYKRGLENNPEYWRLWSDTALLYNQRLKDYPDAAIYYEKASELPGSPIFLERFPALMFNNVHANDDAQAYAQWKALWERLTPEQRAMKEHEGPRIESEIRGLELKLSIPKEKRVFPN